VTGGPTTEKQIFTFTKFGAVPIKNGIFKLNSAEPIIQNGIFKLNTSLKKKSYPISIKSTENELPTTSGIIQKEITDPRTVLIKNPSSLSSKTPSTAPAKTTTTESLDIEITEENIAPEKIIIQTTDQTSTQLTELTALDHVVEHPDIQDDGYHSPGSPGSSTGESSMDIDNFEPEKNEMTNEPIEYIQEFIVDNVINTEGLDFQLIDETDSSIDADYTSDDSSNSWEDDLSSKLIDTEKDPAWYPHNYELQKVAVYDNSDLHQALYPKKDKSTNKKKTINRHRKGPIPLCLDEMDEEKKKNVTRCREYRCKKKDAVLEEMSELEMLEQKNKNLKKQEQEVKDKVKRFKAMYIKMISEGRIKFC